MVHVGENPGTVSRWPDHKNTGLGRRLASSRDDVSPRDAVGEGRQTLSKQPLSLRPAKRLTPLWTLSKFSFATSRGWGKVCWLPSDGCSPPGGGCHPPCAQACFGLSSVTFCLFSLFFSSLRFLPQPRVFCSLKAVTTFCDVRLAGPTGIAYAWAIRSLAGAVVIIKQGGIHGLPYRGRVSGKAIQE